MLVCGNIVTTILVNDLFALLDHLELKQSYVLRLVLRFDDRPSRRHAFSRIACRGSCSKAVSLVDRLFARNCFSRGLTCYSPGSMRHLPYRQRILERTHRRSVYHPAAGGLADLSRMDRRDAHCRRRPAGARLCNRVDLRPMPCRESASRYCFVCGDRDPLIGAAQEEVLLQGLPNAGRVVIPGCGHMASYTHPEAVASITRDFLTPPS